MKRLLALLPLSSINVYGNPTSGWNEDYSYGDTTGDFSTLPYFLLLIAIFLVPYLIIQTIDFFKSKSSLKKDIKLEIEANNIKDNAVDDNSYENAYKQHAKELTKEMYAKANNDFNTKQTDKSNTLNREPFYILIILILLSLMYVQYSKYREDSYSRVTKCFEDVTPDYEIEFCESFYEKYR